MLDNTWAKSSKCAVAEGQCMVAKAMANLDFTYAAWAESICATAARKCANG
jgi:hypothetical protein